MTGGPPISIRGWQTMPTASAMAHQIKQKLPVPLGAHDRRGDLTGNRVADFARKLAQATDHLAMLLRIAHHAPLAYRAFADFELGFDQRHNVAGWAQQVPNPRQHQPQGDERDVEDGQVGRHWQLIEVSDVDPLHHGYAWILPEAPRQLTVADVDCDHARRPALEEDVGETAGRRADIERGPAGRIDREGIERCRQLFSTATDVGRGAGHLDRLLRRHHLVRLARGHASYPDETGPNHRLGSLPRGDK